MTTYQEKKYPHARVETDMTKNNEDETVTFFPQGGGFNYVMPHAKFHETFELAPKPQWRKGYVDADWTEGMGPDGTFLKYPCWTDGSRWNGWGSPYFERATAEQIVATNAELGGYVMLWQDDAVVATPNPEYPDEIDTYAPRYLDNGLKVWGIGAGSWCWNSVTIVPTIEETTLRIQHDILALIKEGVMPSSVASFEDVQDHCDGNCLGGLCEDDLFDALILFYGNRDKDEGMPEGMCHHINEAHNAVSDWLAAGGHLKEI